MCCTYDVSEVERLGEAVGWLNLWGTTNKGASDVNVRREVDLELEAN